MKQLPGFLKYFIPFSAVLFITQKFVTTSVLNNITFFYETWNIYTFHILSTLIIYCFVLFVNKKFSDKTGFAFLSGSVLKMMAVVVFLIPLIKSNVKDPIPDISAFFIPYFLFLFFETLFTIRLINN